jgi:hypothetical protein
VGLPFLIHIYRCTLWKRDAVGCVEVSEAYLADADVEDDGYQSSQELTMFSWVEFGTWQCIVAEYLLVVVEDDAVAYFPNEVVGSAGAEPILEDIPNTESAVMVGEEAPRALQP